MVYQFNEMLSTSLIKEQADKFKGNVFFDITVKIVDEKVGNSLPNYANSACYLANLSAFEQEEEVLFPSGSIFLISKKQ